MASYAVYHHGAAARATLKAAVESALAKAATLSPDRLRFAQGHFDMLVSWCFHCKCSQVPDDMAQSQAPTSRAISNAATKIPLSVSIVQRGRTPPGARS